MSTADGTIDRTHLERLRDRFGAGFLAQMIDLFLAQGQERVDAARQGLAEENADAITSAAHALKSSAGNLGATSLVSRAAEVERLGRGGASATELAPQVNALIADFESASTALRALRTGLLA